MGYCALFVLFIVAFFFSFFFNIIFCRFRWDTAWVTAVVPIWVVISIRVVVRVRVAVRIGVRGGLLYGHCRMYSHCRERSCGVDGRMYCWVCVRVWVVVQVGGVLIGVLSIMQGIPRMFIPRVVNSTGFSYKRKWTIVNNSRSWAYNHILDWHHLLNWYHILDCRRTTYTFLVFILFHVIWLLQSALDDLRRHLSRNGYPRGIISYNMNDVVNKHQNKPKDIITVPKKEIFIVLPYLGIQSKIVTQQLKSCIYKFYGCFNLKIIFRNTRRIKSFFPYKDKLNRSLKVPLTPKIFLSRQKGPFCSDHIGEKIIVVRFFLDFLWIFKRPRLLHVQCYNVSVSRGR